MKTVFVRLSIIIACCLISFNLYASSASYSGSGRYGSGNHYQYEIKGALVVRPDQAVFPITISVEDKSYEQALANANKVQQEIKSRLKKLDGKIFSISAVDFFKQNVEGKRYAKISFFSRGRSNATNARMIVNLVVRFDEKHSFQDRARLIARAYDFLNTIHNTSANKEKIRVSAGNVEYSIDNVEKYRASVVKQIYQRGRVMVDIVAKQENALAFIRKVHFSQDIQQNMHDFNKATLSIDAKIEFGIRHRKTKGK